MDAKCSPMKFRKVPCAFCGEDHHKIIFTAKDNRLHTVDQEFNVVICQKCGLIYINPQPSNEELNKFYPSDYYTPHSSWCDRLYTPIVNRIFKRIIGEIKRIKGKGKILDVGCGTGLLLSKFQKKGYDVFGVDPNPNILKVMPKDIRNKIKIGSLLDSNFKESYFDIIIMKQVLEHIPNPNTVLSETYRILKTDGILYVEVPNFYCPEANLFGKYWYNLEVPRHLYQYSVSSLLNLLQKHNFEPIILLGNSGCMIFKSPLAVVNSFKFFLDSIKVFKWGILRSIAAGISFVPFVILTFLLRILSSNPGMDIRIISRKRSIHEAKSDAGKCEDGGIIAFRLNE